MLVKERFLLVIWRKNNDAITGVEVEIIRYSNIADAQEAEKQAKGYGWDGRIDYSPYLDREILDLPFLAKAAR